MVVGDEWGYEEDVHYFDGDEYYESPSAASSSSWQPSSFAWDQEHYEPWLENDHWQDPSGWHYDPWYGDGAGSTSYADYADNARASSEASSQF